MTNSINDGYGNPTSNPNTYGNDTTTNTTTPGGTAYTGTTTSTTTETALTSGTTVGFENITQPGCYVCNATGHLLRVYNTFDARNWNSSFGITGRSPFSFTYVTADPTSSLDTVRDQAGEYGIDCNF